MYVRNVRFTRRVPKNEAHVVLVGSCKTQRSELMIAPVITRVFVSVNRICIHRHFLVARAPVRVNWRATMQLSKLADPRMQ